MQRAGRSSPSSFGSTKQVTGENRMEEEGTGGEQTLAVRSQINGRDHINGQANVDCQII